jgi:hypothetical protein
LIGRKSDSSSRRSKIASNNLTGSNSNLVFPNISLISHRPTQTKKKKNRKNRDRLFMLDIENFIGYFETT